MYRDPGLIKKHPVKVRLDDYLNDEIEAIATVTGEQKAVIARQLLELGLKELHGVDSAVVVPFKEGLVQTLTRVA